MKPFLHGKKNLTVPALRLPATPANAPQRSCATAHAPAASLEHAAGANVEVVKEGDKVARLIVTCACGEKIEIDCIYPVGA